MVNHEEYMRRIEKKLMHGSMTAAERLELISNIVSEYRIEIEEETGRPFDQE